MTTKSVDCILLQLLLRRSMLLLPLLLLLYKNPQHVDIHNIQLFIHTYMYMFNLSTYTHVHINKYDVERITQALASATLLKGWVQTKNRRRN